MDTFIYYLELLNGEHRTTTISSSPWKVPMSSGGTGAARSLSAATAAAELLLSTPSKSISQPWQLFTPTV